MNISAINLELAKIGYKAVKLPKAKGIAGWKPQTAGGRACKAAMAYWASWPKPQPPKFSAEWFVTSVLGKPSRHAPLDRVAYYLECMADRGPLLLSDYGRMADGSPVNMVFGQAHGPITRIVCE